MTTRDPNIGRRIGARFVLEAPLGAGGMGRIYRARDEQLGAGVAIKLLKRAHLEDAVLRERFRREAFALSTLRHRGLVEVFDFGETDEGDLYTALELVQGDTLARTLESSGPISCERAAPLFDQILSALGVCHARDIVHRDVKPANVMVSERSGGDVHVKLIDFGLARIEGASIEKLTETGIVHGTPHYMAPEQCRGELVGPEADVYAAGAVFYEMLSGRAPFQGTDAATFMAQHLFVDPAPLRQVAPSVSAGVAAAVHAALAKRPHDRPTASELRDLLASAIAGTDPQALAAAAADARRDGSGLDRSARAVDERGVTLGTSEDARALSAKVVVWMKLDDRSVRLRSSLGVAGLACIPWEDEAVPAVESVDVVVIASDAIARLALVRTRAPKLSVVVVDVASPDETTAAIRAGANDMLLREASDGDLAPKIRRLLRKQRRRT